MVPIDIPAMTYIGCSPETRAYRLRSHLHDIAVIVGQFQTYTKEYSGLQDCKLTIMILSFQTDRSGQTEDQSD